MHGKPSKKKSKRVKLSMKYKIQRKVKEHHRKLKKDIKKNPWKYKKSKKDQGIPNTVPFKAEIIQEAREAHEFEEEIRQKKRVELKMRRKDDKLKTFNSNRNIRDYIESSQKNLEEFEAKSSGACDKEEFSDKSAKAYYKEFKKVVEAADVVLEVLDARDPEGSRCPSMEKMINEDPNKKLVLILNKSDLVPRECLELWLKYLRGQHPTLLFKSSTQKQSGNLSHAKVKVSKYNDSIKTSQCVGASELMELLKNYCRSFGIKTAISVGVVGLPNVGKSSLVNSLKRTKACNVGATPGITKTIQEVSLDSKIRILDCPGLILPGENSSDIQSSLRNAYKIENLKDPITPVQAIIEKVGKEQILLQYKLREFEDAVEFLSLVATKTGRYKKGGRPDVEKAAVSVLRDWNVGKIKYCTYPPAINTTDAPEPIDTTDAPKPIDTTDAPEPIDTTDAPEQIDTTDAPEQIDTTDAPEQIDTTDASEPIDITDASEPIDITDAQEPIVHPSQTDDSTTEKMACDEEQ